MGASAAGFVSLPATSQGLRRLVALSGAVALLACASLALAVTPSGTVPCTPEHVNDHDPDLARVSDALVCFKAYLSNFDTDKSSADGSGKDILGIPHWVIQHVHKAKRSPESRKRPRAWFTVPALEAAGFAPTDDSYHFSQHFRANHSNWYERGHLAQKYLAERLGKSAGWFTHNVANAVPQRAQFNKGPWLSLECLTGAWANEYGDVWVIAGPIFVSGHPSKWLKSDMNKKALPVAIPTMLFKIVVRKAVDGSWIALAFIYPQEDSSYKKRPWHESDRLTSVAQIEKLTGETFFVDQSVKVSPPEKETAERLWPIKKDYFDTGCRSMAKDIP